MSITNLDALRAPSHKVVFLGLDYELGYIPAGAAIPVMESYLELVHKQEAAAGASTMDSSAAMAALESYSRQKPAEVVADTIKFLSRFCHFYYPEREASDFEKDINDHASKDMVDSFFTVIVKAICVNAAVAGSETESRSKSKKNKTGRN
jgi:hypothetical protein